MTKGAPVYQRKEKASADEKDSYFEVRTKDDYQYAQNMLFPRMYDSSHARDYESWMGGIEGTQVPYDRCGENIMVKMPTQLENIKFFLSYQCNFMYWRYFMWNFCGRQNQIQGNGELEHGNWITGTTRDITCSTDCRCCSASSASSGKPSADAVASDSSG